MFDLKLDVNGDLALSETGDITTTDSTAQAVRLRVLWFLKEWRLEPGMGIPYFEHVLVKNPSDAKIRHLIREAVMAVDGVTDVRDILVTSDRQTRKAAISLTVVTDEETFREEVIIAWPSMD